MMITNSVDSYNFAIEFESVGIIKRKISDTECSFVIIKKFTVFTQCNFSRINLRRIGSPKQRIVNSKIVESFQVVSRNIIVEFGSNCSVRVKNFDINIVFTFATNLSRNCNIGRIVCNIGSCNKSLGLDNMFFVNFFQVNISVNTRTRIPTGIRLVRIVNSNRNQIVFSEFQIFRDVVLKTYITVRTKTNFFAININC